MKKVKKVLSLLLSFALLSSTFTASLYAKAAPSTLTDEAKQYVFVNPISNLSSDFAKGADVSALTHLEENGMTYYDNNVSNDALTILKNNGVNWIRVRIWNNPTGGGYCDQANALSLAKRAKALGMKVFLDFHYSDTWTAPGTQTKPAAWADDTGDVLVQDVYDYTAQVIQDMNDQDTTPDMVQIGNELNGGMLFPDGQLYLDGDDNYDGLAALLNSGIQAVRDNQPTAEDGTTTKIDVMLHVANTGGSYAYGNDNWFYTQMEAAGVTDFDVIGLSYYPYWHGTLSDFTTTITQLADDFDKPICVVETGYAYSLDNYDSCSNNFSNYSSSMENLSGYAATPQGQATEVRDVMAAVASLGDMGYGVFYWEPEWIAGDGSDYSSDGSGDSWDNQTLFDKNGNALPSIKVFNLVSGTQSSVSTSISSIETSEITTTMGTEPTMPTTVYAINNDGSIDEQSVTWNSIDSTEYASPGSFTAYGTVSGTSVKAVATIYVTQVSNLLSNPGFEDGDATSWTVTDGSDSLMVSTSTPHTGTYSYNFWGSSAFSFEFSQTVTGISNGTYLLSGYCDGLAGSAPTLFAKDFGGTDLTATATNAGWDNWQNPSIIVTVENNQCTVGFTYDGVAGDWGDIDDICLVPCDSEGNKISATTLPLSASSTVASGSSIDVTEAISGLSSTIYSLTETISYDPEVFFYKSAAAAADDITVDSVVDDRTSGTLTVTLSDSAGLSSDSDLVTLSFASKNPTELTYSKLSASDATLFTTADASDEGTDISGSSITAIAVYVNRTNLTSLVQIYGKLIDSITEGTQRGQYRIGAKQAFTNAVNDAYTVSQNLASTASDVNNSLRELKNAKKALDKPRI